jgi:putative membrane protein
MKTTFSTILKGFVIGAGMTVPGLSGGSMAMILGIYDKLVTSVSRIFSEPKKNLTFLLKFCLGAGLGFFLLAGIIARLLDTAAGIPLRFLFLGAVAGGIPLIVRNAHIAKLSVGDVLLILSGIAAVIALSCLPAGIISPGRNSIGAVIIQLIGGIVVAAALVLPGISASHMMYMLGIYDNVLERISNLDILPLIPLAVGVVVGTFLTARLLERLLERHSKGCYLVIFGFMAGSLAELIPKNADLVQTIIGIICAIIGFIAVRTLCGKEIKRAAESNS